MLERQQAGETYGYDHLTADVLKADMAFSEASPGPGDALPQFDLLTLEGEQVHIGDLYRERPLLLITGSVSCPMTASSIEVVKRLHADYGDRVQFVMLNVREAHPGENIPQPDALEEKLKHGRMLKERFEIPWTVLSDDVEGTAHRLLDEKPNSAHLIDTAGRIAFRALWVADEDSLREAMDRGLSNEEPKPGQSERKMVPLMMGAGEMRDAVRRAGPAAERDIWRAAFPMAMTAWIANWFRPLPPLWRGLSAMMVQLVVVVAVIGVIVAWLI